MRSWLNGTAGSIARCPQMSSAISSDRSLIGSPGSRPPAVPWSRTASISIALAPAEDFRRDSDLFGEGVHNPEAQSRIRAAMKRGFQTRDAEMALARMLGDLADR
jgi:hypothetical protein